MQYKAVVATVVVLVVVVVVVISVVIIIIMSPSCEKNSADFCIKTVITILFVYAQADVSLSR